MKFYLKVFNNFRNILRGTVYLIGIVALLLVTPKLFHTDPAIILSGSMSPTLKIGDIVYIRKGNSYQVDDIISFRYEGVEKSSTHRIVSIDIDGNIYTKGDNNDSVDMVTITSEQIEGRVVFTIPKLGYAISKLQTKRWKILLVCIISINFLLGFIDTDDKEGVKNEA